MQQAPANTLLGLLQRGRGKGFLHALERPPTAGDDLVRCIVEDPRVDRQVESREEFYGDLGFELELELDPLARHLFDTADGRVGDEYRTGLTIYVLARLAQRGRADALDVVTKYAVRGTNWRWALHALASLRADLVDPVIDPLLHRIGAEELAAELRRMDPSRADEWRSNHTSLDRAWTSLEQSRTPLSPYRDPTHPSEYYLELQNGFWTLRHRTSDADKELLRRTARDPRSSVMARRNALIALGYHGDTSLVDIADEFLGDVAETWGEPLPSAGWRYTMSILKKGPVQSLRRWLDRPGPRRELALHMLGRWGVGPDVGIMRPALYEYWRQRDYYVTSDLVEGLGRLRDDASISVIREIFEQSAYSYLRSRAAATLAAIDASFTSALAVECLWDCEQATRELACARVSASAPLAHARLSELAASPYEEEPVRRAAASRLLA